MSLNKNWVKFRQLGRVKTKTGLSLEACMFRFLVTISLLPYKFAAPLLHISQIFAALELHYSPNLPHICRTLSSLRKVRNFAALNRCLSPSLGNVSLNVVFEGTGRRVSNERVRGRSPLQLLYLRKPLS